VFPIPSCPEEFHPQAKSFPSSEGISRRKKEKSEKEREWNKKMIFFLFFFFVVFFHQKKVFSKEKVSSQLREKKERQKELTTKRQGVISSTSNRSDSVVEKETHNNGFVSVFVVTHTKLSFVVSSPSKEFVLFCEGKKKKEKKGRKE
jgi:hypothetical protein